MSWAMRRRIVYFLGVVAFLAVVIGVPAYFILHKAPTCDDGIQNQDETSPDHGGPCVLLDDTAITPHAVLWARSFKVRDGSYDSAAYIENPNNGAGVEKVGYRFGLYDSSNVLIAERTGTTFIMPAGITPVFEGSIPTGNRDVTHTFFTFIRPPIWKRMHSVASEIAVSDKEISDIAIMPRLTATVQNISVEDLRDLSFVAVVFDPAGNAFASSATALPRLSSKEKHTIIFTWPQPFKIAIGRTDIITLVAPRAEPPVQ